MKKLITAALKLLAISFAIQCALVSASAVEKPKSDSNSDDVRTLTAEYVDEDMLKYAFATAVNDDAELIRIRVSRAQSEFDQPNLVEMLGNIQNLWSYRAPETYNYTRNTGIRTVSRGNEFDIEIVLGNSYGLEIQSAHEQKRIAEARAAEIYAELIANGCIPDGASQTEIARAALEYICANVTYVNDGTDMCHTAYSALVNHYAVCDGYTGAYNLILKQAGITCYGIKGWAGGGCHEWTAAVLDGELRYIDSTWCDVEGENPAIDISWFAVAPDSMPDHTAYYV